MVKGGEIGEFGGEFGGGWLEHPRQWQGTRCPVSSAWERRAAQSRQAPP